ncbi:unnamed protein product [Blepharisma stoltei]|uniref:Peptidase M14 domain-containing protein n=1 Tax=Blepharisma stoltei TaxID=1481888 RepID=A0AAU9JR22_9CILI|nr:unnamed protein product [Blepharisma stoltei]
MMQGAIEFLLGNSKEAKILRENFIFRIIPMLNPDGVIYGNYRTSLLGVDLNRRWQFPNKHLHPTIYYAKRFIKMFSEDHELVLYLDMHGHSMKKNVFMYCCCSQGKEMEDRKTNVLIKLVPLLLSEKNKIFSFKDSKFRMEKSKESTSRIVLFKELHLLNSYTLESSFYGPSHRARLENREPEENEPEGDAHMDRQHLKNLGADTCKVCLIYCNPLLFKKKIQTILNKFRKKPQPFHFSQRKINKSLKELESSDEKDSSDTENEEENIENIEEIEEDFHLDEALKVIEGNESLMDIEQLWKIDEVSSSDSSQSENENEETKRDLSNEIRLKRRKNTKRTSRSPKKHQTSSVPRPKQCSHLPRINPLRPVTIIERKPIQEVLEHNLDSIYNLLQSWDKQTMKANDFFRQPKRNLHEISDDRDFDYLKTLSTKAKLPDSPNDYFKITSANFFKKPPSRKGVRSLSRREEIQVQKFKNGMRPLDIRKENPYDPMPLSAFSYHSDINLTKKYK